MAWAKIHKPKTPGEPLAHNSAFVDSRPACGANGGPTVSPRLPSWVDCKRCLAMTVEGFDS